MSWVKKAVYLIARGRPILVEGKLLIQWTTLGSGFIASPHRLLTASHVIDDPQSSDDVRHHKQGDTYYLLRNDGDHFHWRSFVPALDQQLFLYPELDLAIIYLDDLFYSTGEEFGLSRNNYLDIDTKIRTIGSQVGVLGYPLTKLQFEGGDWTKPRAGDVFLRADHGIINTRYKTSDGFTMYEFTIMFNPGNSGGPIFDAKTGQVVSMVRGFRSVPIKTEEVLISVEQSKSLKTYNQRAYIDVTHSIYSVGVGASTPKLEDILKRHNILKTIPSPVNKSTKP